MAVKQGIFTVLSNTMLAPAVYRMELAGDTSAITKPGQFVNIRLAGKFLRRPISVNDWETGKLTIIYKVVGSGTAQMAAMEPGTELDILSGLGNGYDITKAGTAPVLVGGGVGIPPLYGLAKALLAQGIRPRAVLGFNRKDEIFLAEEFRALGVETVVATMDGSAGVKGLVTDALKDMAPGYIFSCGPLPMLRAICESTECSGQYSFEERMGCGFGACMGCTCKTKYGNKRICREGPVLEKEEIIW